MRLPSLPLLLLTILAGCNSLSNTRLKRQSTCSPNDYRCKNGQCVDGFSVCDGTKDCSDGSDETKSSCSGLDIQCPSHGFKCAYGACIERKLTCDGKADCADNSDELLLECRDNQPSTTNNSITNCKRDEFTCQSGQCIAQDSLCDGEVNCRDGSDETISECVNFWCEWYTFHCTYGACIEKSKKCDGKKDCADGSDEDPELCQSPDAPRRPVIPADQLPSGPSMSYPGGCALPDQPDGGQYSVQAQDCGPQDQRPKCRGVPGTSVPNKSVIKYDCFRNYQFSGASTTSFCIDGTWYPVENLSLCKKNCRPLRSSAHDISCRFRDEPADCSKDVRAGTRASVKCKDHYRPAGPAEETFSETVCEDNGQWSLPLYRCNPECGKRHYDGAIATVSYGENTSIVQYPWHAGLYMKNKEGVWDVACGGTIITPYMILTAAHCIYDGERRRNETEIKISVGKTTRDINVIDPGQQIIDVKEVIPKREYTGKGTYYAIDVAILDLKVTIQLQSFILPVCVEWTTHTLLKEGTLGTVVGWGLTENKTKSDTLQVAHLPYIEREQCMKISPKNFLPFITSDKFCAGYTNGTGVQMGDSGGGLVFERRDSELYYIFGIVSLKQRLSNVVAAFTNITSHIRFIESTREALRRRHDKQL